jgi:SpoVK/Ycf46/Vps4 family AAA+-type ATPase
LLWIVSPEERRVETDLARLAKASDMELIPWAITTGLNGTGEAADPQGVLGAIASYNKRALFVLRDFHPFLDAQQPANVSIIRAVRDLASALKTTPKDKAKTVIFLSCKQTIPDELIKDIVLLEWKLPGKEELETLFDAVVNPLPEKIKEAVAKQDKDSIVKAAFGLTTEEASNCFSRCLVETQDLTANYVMREKKQVVAKDGLLTWIEPQGGLEAVGGYDLLKAWLMQRRTAFEEKARTYGLPMPKGILLSGPPGVGKSLAAKAIGIAWQMPVIKLDMGKLYGKYVGESEGNVRRALALAEAVAPCILWVN